MAAQREGIDGDAFIDEVVSRNVVSFASKPITLDFLIRTFKKNGSLPKKRTELYLEGCNMLCEESQERQDSPGTRGHLAASQRMAVAGRIAAVMQVSNRSALWLGPTAGLPEEDLAMDQLAGGRIGDPGQEFEVDIAGLRETSGTGLFSSRGIHRQGWRHQTYSEYLAATHLISRGLKERHLRKLILHPDGSGKVVPQLRELAAWLADLNARFFRMFLYSDPEVLLGCELETATERDKSDLARAVLERFEGDAVAESLWALRDAFARLKSHELPEIVKPYLSKPDRASDAVFAAIEMVHACGLAELHTDLVAIAVDPGAKMGLRTRAARVIAQAGGPEARAALRPLALGTAGDDPDDQLKGYALAGMWPGQLTAEEFFQVLTPPKRNNFFGAYRNFLAGDVVAELQEADLPNALDWAIRSGAGRSGINVLYKIATAVLIKSIEHISNPEVPEKLAGAIAARFAEFTGLDKLAAKLLGAGNAARRSVAQALFPFEEVRRRGSYNIVYVCSLSSSDLPWLLRELEAAIGGKKRGLICAMIAQLLDGEDLITFDAVLRTSEFMPELKTAIEPIIAPVILDSPEAASARENHRQLTAVAGPNNRKSARSALERISDLLGQNAAPSFFDLYCGLEEVGSGNAFAAFTELDAGIQARILAAGFEYLQARPPTPEGNWWRDGRSTYGMSVGKAALHLLAINSPHLLDELSDSDWAFWTRVILADWIGDEESIRSKLLEKAYEHAARVFKETVSDIIDGENERHQ